MRRFLRTALAGLTAAILAAGCAPKELPDLPPSPGVPEPDPADVESVIFFVGDPGYTRMRFHPIMVAAQREIEAWSAAVDPGADVAVVLMGDIVYPAGVRDRSDPGFQADSLHVRTQVRLVAGEAARRQARAYFTAGNHDWGREQDWEGRHRLINLNRLLESFAAQGLPVGLEPPPGEGGPAIVDLGDHVRLLLLDTAWWLMDAEDAERDAMVRRLEAAVTGAGERAVIISSHHPYQSAGAHGSRVSFWEGLGVPAILGRAGAILQDLNSRPYRQLRGAIRDIGARHGPALLHAGGHDHSIQLIRTDDGGPRYSLVAGSTTKLTDVGHIDGMLVRRAWPGYAVAFGLRDGGVLLSIRGAPPEHIECDPGPGREACIEAGVAAYRTLWSGRLR